MTTMLATLLLYLGLLLPSTLSFPAYPTYTTTLPAYTAYPNMTALLEERTRDLDKRQQIIGTGICETAMQGFECNMSNHLQDRCASNYDYCICAGEANGAGVDGLWLNTAWGPGCNACYGSSVGQIFDGTCDGDGGGGTGQSVDDIMATLTITVVVVQVSGAERNTRVRRYR